jgi:hypothetical protein
MKKTITILFLLILVYPILSCHKEEKVETKLLPDYLPLKVGAKYKYEYGGSSNSGDPYGHMDSYRDTGIVTWNFISVSVDTPFVYTVESKYNGITIHNSNGQIDTTRFINSSTFTFKVLDDKNVQWGDFTLRRYLDSGKDEICYPFEFPETICLRKNVGIVNHYWVQTGNFHSNSGYLKLLEGPY